VLLVGKVTGGLPGEQRTTDEKKLMPQRGVFLVDKAAAVVQVACVWSVLRSTFLSFLIRAS
jgi:hypothetical protein